jgi:hypothetical protein
MPDDTKTARQVPSDLYERDLYAWANSQAENLRDVGDALERDAGRTQLLRLLHRLDWANLAEEIEALGKSQRHELGSRIATIIEHLAKLEHSRAVEPRAGWMVTVERERGEIAEVLRDNPSLQRALPELVAARQAGTIRLAVRTLAWHGEASDAVLARLRDRTYGLDEIIGDWWPDTAAAPEPHQGETPTRRRRRRARD